MQKMRKDSSREWYVNLLLKTKTGFPTARLMSSIPTRSINIFKRIGDLSPDPSGFAWLDTGTHDSLSEASTYIEVLEKRQGLKVACLEGIAYRQGWITEVRMRELAEPMLKNQYGQYLLKVIDELKETGNPNLD